MTQKIGNLDIQFDADVPTFENFMARLDEKVADIKFALRSIIHSELLVFGSKINAALLKRIEQVDNHLLDVAVKFTVDDHVTFRKQLAYIHPGWEQLLGIPQNYDDMEDTQMEITALVFQPLIDSIQSKGYHAQVERLNPTIDGMTIRIRPPHAV
jgi:hypothetical protein